ncbi:MAG: UDP-N-acetylmuramoyl-tripeptide--D-alanyl-D-alanine ligase [Gammaproteobacteria bacterium]|jgi:UDP-N-acetylmuramoyl-tripeptide--D-alanyl-D-alanine ligase
MIAMQLSEISTVVGARMQGPDVAVRGVSTDSRQVCAGQLYVALRGPNFDGHRFIESARELHCAAVLCERAVDELPSAIVNDTLRSFGELATNWRKRFDVDVVAVTGSNGKTTVKEMIASILACDAPVLATRGNLNNNVGVPLTLARLGKKHRRLVAELGANHPGEIAMLGEMVLPRVGVITLIAPAHLEGFGSIEAVAHAKGELIEALPDDGVAVVNADDDYLPLWRELAQQRRIVTFGFAADADVRAHYAAGEEGAKVTLTIGRDQIHAQLQLFGVHNAANAAAAAAAALAMGVDANCIQRGLEATAPVEGRLRLFTNSRGTSVIDDTYNANPHSLRAALAVLAERKGTRWLVLGDMAELGPDADDFHAQAGIQAREAGVHRLFAVGDLSRLCVEAFGKGAHHYPDRDALCEALNESLVGDESVLVKGSRSMAMDAVVQRLLREASPCC